MNPDVLHNTVRLLNESLADAVHYAEQVELILKERKTEEKNTVNIKKKKERKPLRKELNS